MVTIKSKFCTCSQGNVLSSIYFAQNNDLRSGEKSSTSLMLSSREVGVNLSFPMYPCEQVQNAG